MWLFATIIILLTEIALLVCFIIGRSRKRRLNETLVFLGIAFAVTLALNVVPYIHSVVGTEGDSNLILGLLGCFHAALELFVGKPAPDGVAAFAAEVPLFSVAYLIGTGLAVLATVSAAVEAFGNMIRNGFRLKKALKRPYCDLVVGNSPEALEYAENNAAVLLLDNSVSKETVAGLMEENFVVLRKGLTRSLMEDRRFNTVSRYNIICMEESKALGHVDAFIAYKKAHPDEKNVFLYVQIEGSKAEAVRREVIEKSDCEQWIDTFCAKELLARQFVEEYPIAKLLPKAWIKDGAVCPEAKIHTFFLGFGPRSQELYRQSVLNNQLVTFAEDTYKLLPICYHLCDTQLDTACLAGAELKEALAELDSARYFPLPELPFDTEVIHEAPGSWACLQAIKKALRYENSFGVLIVDTGCDFGSIELGVKLKRQLADMENLHIFVHSEAAFVEDNAGITYFGKGQSVLTHDVIVNDSLSTMAKKLNEVYTAREKQDQRNRPDFAQYVKEEAEKAWNGFDYFKIYSNIYGAMSLRQKLNLLGLDYKTDGKRENLGLLQERYPNPDYSYEDHGKQSVRNALIAQEHARWNAYHLLGGYLPLAREEIKASTADDGKVYYRTKDTTVRLHACLTTYEGLSQLSKHLAEKAQDQPADHDYYKYDEMLITSAEELLRQLGYSLMER